MQIFFVINKIIKKAKTNINMKLKSKIKLIYSLFKT